MRADGDGGGGAQGDHEEGLGWVVGARGDGHDRKDLLRVRA